MPVAVIAKLSVKLDQLSEFESAFALYQQKVRTLEAGILFFEGRNIQSELLKIQPYKKITRYEIDTSISLPENLSSDELLEPFADEKDAEAARIKAEADAKAAVAAANAEPVEEKGPESIDDAQNAASEEG